MAWMRNFQYARRFSQVGMLSVSLTSVLIPSLFVCLPLLNCRHPCGRALSILNQFFVLPNCQQPTLRAIFAFDPLNLLDQLCISVLCPSPFIQLHIAVAHCADHVNVEWHQEGSMEEGRHIEVARPSQSWENT